MFPVLVTGPAVHYRAYRYILVTGPAVMYISILMTGPCGDHIETPVPAVMAPPGGAREPALAIK